MIDWTRVSTLRDAVGIDDFDQVVDMVIRELERVLSKLRRAGRSFDCADLGFLKGGACSLGFADFSSLCETGHSLCCQGNHSTIDFCEMASCFKSSKKCYFDDIANLVTS